MQGTVLYGPRDIRFEDRPEPTIAKPTDAILRLSATCICGSDLWPYRGIQPIAQPTPMGHEYCGIVEEVGKEVRNIKPGQFVVGSFATSDNTCAICRHGYQSSCVHREFMSTAQAPYLRVPLADGTLVATSDLPGKELIPSLLATSDVLGTGWFAADAANVKPGSTALVVGDGAVGLLAVLSAKQMGAERIIAMSRHPSRQKLAREFGATSIAKGAEDWSEVDYWLDLGNNSDSGQFVLGEPLNRRNRRHRLRLRTVAELFPEVIQADSDDDSLPSCSAAEALDRQEPFVNPTLANLALALLARLFRYGTISYHGGFVSLSSWPGVQALRVDSKYWKRLRKRGCFAKELKSRRHGSGKAFA